ncbi:MAG: F0F1 ATP synthase subunit delta [Gammaproteobacteria bacterium]
MAEKSTVARPYAQAIFDLAHSQGALHEWSDSLQLVAAITADIRVQRLIANPRVRGDRLQSLLLDIGGARLTPGVQNLIKVLIVNHRLVLLPEIAALYEFYRAEAERTMQAEVVSAFPVSEEQQKNIAAALKKRLGRDVSLTCKVDSDLLGGAIIRAGDLVIDGSVKGQLVKLSGALRG